MVAASCRRPNLLEAACAWTPHGSFLQGFPSPMEDAGMRPEIEINPLLGAPLLIFSSTPSPDVVSTMGYFRKTACVWNQSFSSPRSAAEAYRVSPASLSFILLATRFQQVVFAYDQVIRHHRSYRHSVGLPSGKYRIRHKWI